MDGVQVKTEPNDEMFTSVIDIVEHAIKLEPEDDEKDFLWEQQNAQISGFCGPYDLKHHMTAHEKPKIQCNLCGKKFKWPGNLTDHVHYVHSANTKRLQCDKCPSKFKSKSNLNAHKERMHTNIKYRCKICNIPIKTAHYLRVHLRLKHASVQKFECKMCQRSFSLLWVLNKHNKAQHPENRESEQCFTHGGFRRALLGGALGDGRIGLTLQQTDSRGNGLDLLDGTSQTEVRVAPIQGSSKQSQNRARDQKADPGRVVTSSSVKLVLESTLDGPASVWDVDFASAKRYLPVFLVAGATCLIIVTYVGRSYNPLIDEYKTLYNASTPLYPDWVMRVYHNASDPHVRHLLCQMQCSYGEFLETCFVGELPGYGNLTGIHPMVWRFLPMSDPLVDVALSRDLDSNLSERELAAVQEWLSSGAALHVMRDHIHHNTEIL
ncbi:hypothetical protein B566_EDAN015514, partial [Ephemera danica]